MSMFAMTISINFTQAIVITSARKQVAAERSQTRKRKPGKVRTAKKSHQKGLQLGMMNTKTAGDCARIFLFAALLIFAGISCPTRLHASDATLRPGDMIDLKLGGVPSTETQSVSGQYQIDADGLVNMPNIGKVRIGGLSPAAAEIAIQNAYTAKEIYTHPTIIITMQPQSRWVNVGGEVKAPER